MPKHQPGVGDKNVLMMGDQRTEVLRCNGVVRRRSLSRLDRVNPRTRARRVRMSQSVFKCPEITNKVT
jgi:hypothetical protein